MAKNLPTMQETQVGKTPWRRKWQPTPVFLLVFEGALYLAEIKILNADSN